MDDDEFIPASVKFDCSTLEKEEYSKEYTVNLTLDPDSFLLNDVNIRKSCTDFKTEEERVYYHMFDPNKLKFINNSDELKPYVKFKKTIILKNCSELAREIIIRLRDEEEKLRTGVLSELKDCTDEITTEMIEADSKKKQLKYIIYQMANNFFDIDLLSEEFIVYEGIKYLVAVLQYIGGNIRLYAIQALSKVMAFESSSEYISKKKNIIETIYNVFVTSDSLNCSIYTLDTLISIISQDRDRSMYLIEVAEKYAKKSHIPIFSHIVELLSEKNPEVKNKTKVLLFINILMNFSDKSRWMKLLKELKEQGLNESLHKIGKSKDSEFQEQMTNFQMKSGILIPGSDYSIEFYKNKLKNEKIRCAAIENKFQTFIEKQSYYENVIHDLIYCQGYINKFIKQGGYYDSKVPIERHDNYPYIEIKYDENSIFDFKYALQNQLNKSKMDTIFKYDNLKLDCSNMKIENKNLEIKEQTFLNERKRGLESQIKIEQFKSKDMEKGFLEIQQKANDLMTKVNNALIAQGGTVPPEAQPAIEPTPPPPPPGGEEPITPPPSGPDGPPSAPGGPPPPPPPPPPLPPMMFPGRAPTFGTIKPRKPVIKIKAKLKKLQWNRILLKPNGDPEKENGFWHDLKEPKIDIDEVANLFSLKSKEVKEKPKPKIIVKKFLEGKRTQLIGIALAKLPPIETVNSALIEMDESLLDRDSVESILKILITKEELEIYKKQDGEPGEWDKGEQYLLDINKIPYHKDKLRIWSIVYNFNALIPEVEKSFDYLIPACDELTNNNHLYLYLSVILSLGNILNGGTNKGQADGFGIDLLSKMSSIKDNNGNSIFNFISSKVKQLDFYFDGFKHSFPQLERAVDYSLDESTRRVNELTKMINEAENICESLPNDDTFKRKAKDNLRGLKNQMKNLENLWRKNTEYYRKTITFFGCTKKDKYYDKNELFFKMMIDFFNEVEKYMPAFDIRKILSNQNAGKKVNRNLQIKNLLKDMRSKLKAGKTKSK